MSTKLMPDAKPQLGPDKVREVAKKMIMADINCHGADILVICPVMVLGVRGYFRNTLGRPGVNDFGVFDDAGFLITPDVVLPFRWNCDPAKPGWNKGVDKYFAQLEPGVWPFRQGPHKRVPGRFRQMTDEEAELAQLERFFMDSRQDGEFTVRRLKEEKKYDEETGMFNINIHPGSQRSTSSWGCQTVPTSDWDAFQVAAYSAMLKSNQHWSNTVHGWFPYVLTEEKLA